MSVFLFNLLGSLSIKYIIDLICNNGIRYLDLNIIQTPEIVLFLHK